MTTQTTITLAQICDSIAATLGAAAGLVTTQSYNQLTESIPDTPLLQVYPEDIAQDISGSTDRTTLKAGVRQSDTTILADLYAATRAHLGQNMATAVQLADQLIAILEAQDTKPYFGLVGIKAFGWSARRVILVYGAQEFVGFRFTIKVRVF